MPAGIATNPPQHTPKPRASAPPKKRRVVKRRGGVRGELDSDDEIEREPATDDSDLDNDPDFLDSATDDSDTEPVSEDAIPNDRIHLPTPRNSKSPESIVKGPSAPFFAPTSTWSDMVMDDGANGASELPVIDFADFERSPIPRKPTHKFKKSGKITVAARESASPADPLIKEGELSATDVTPSFADTEKVSHNQRQTLQQGHSARQLYQQKLESDPSFVPTIGNFWNHDDRLIDTELRSLSGWWRGRGVRGRGRGRGRGDYGVRGRGGYVGRGRDDDSAKVKEEDIPPVERPWTHDGFEEMKKRDEQRRADHTVARQALLPQKRGSYAARGQGSFIPGRSGNVQGGLSSPGRLPNNTTPSTAYRVRFAMKPELMWTKQHEAFLYLDTSLKARSGQGAGFRVKLPGQQLQVIRASPTPLVSAKEFNPRTTITTGLSKTYIVVRLPKLSGTGAVDVVASENSENATSNFESNSTPVAVEKLQVTQPLIELSTSTTQVATEPAVQAEKESTKPVLSDTERQIKVDQAVFHNPPSAADSEIQPITSSIVERPILPPLQTSFTPPPHRPPQTISHSPAYGSSYGYAVPLPPGIAMNSHGIPYELATGRPVFLQPPPMYNPRPTIHSHYHPSMQLHPGHLHHHSLSNPSPDFLAPSASHTPPMNGFIDPATGTPIFAFPRQTSRVEIRAPGESSSVSQLPVTKASAPRTPSNLRTSSSIFQPASSQLSTESSEGSVYYLQSTAASDSTLPSYEIEGSANVGDPATADTSTMGMMMHYPQHYHHQQYYYPDTYGYPQYMDMTHAGQTYDAYGMNQTPESTVYY